MELRHLKYFVKAAELLNFSEAAKALAVTQSTLSQQLRQLENEMGVQLFERNSHTVILTEAGHELLPYAIETLHSADTCFNRLEDLRLMKSGSLDIGVTYSFSPMLTETLIMFTDRYPNVRLNICYHTMDELMSRLNKRELDFVLAFKPDNKSDNIESHPLFSNRLAVIVKKEHPLARLKSITPEQLSKYKLALPSRGLQARSALDTMMATSPLKFNVAVEMNEVNILLKLIKQTNLVTILSEVTIYGNPEVAAIPIDMPGNEVIGCVHLVKNAYRKRAEVEFIRMLQSSRAVSVYMNHWI